MIALVYFRVQMYKYYTTGSALNSGFTFKVYTRGITYLIAVIQRLVSDLVFSANGSDPHNTYAQIELSSLYAGVLLIQKLLIISSLHPSALVLIFRSFFLEFLESPFSAMIKRRLATRTETMQNQCFTANITFIVAVVDNS